jgi:hypothetical protein
MATPEAIEPMCSPFCKLVVSFIVFNLEMVAVSPSVTTLQRLNTAI